MMKLTKAQIAEIAEELDCSQRVFVHKTTGKIVPLFPADEIDDLMDTFDDEMIAEMEHIEENPDEYHEFEKMDSRKSFEMMEEFTEQVSDAKLRGRLEFALNNSKPFRKFKDEIDNSGDYREEWFAFKKKWYIEWVEEQCD